MRETARVERSGWPAWTNGSERPDGDGRPLPDPSDRAYDDRDCRPFSYRQDERRARFRLPKRAVDAYRDVAENAFSKPIRF
jgi:hypothetical protein